MKKFMENNDGVHLMAVYDEYTLCGDAIDAQCVDDQFDKLEDTNKIVVTCLKCVELIKHCKNVKTKQR